MRVTSVGNWENSRWVRPAACGLLRFFFIKEPRAILKVIAQKERGFKQRHEQYIIVTCFLDRPLSLKLKIENRLEIEKGLVGNLGT